MISWQGPARRAMPRARAGAVVLALACALAITACGCARRSVTAPHHPAATTLPSPPTIPPPPATTAPTLPAPATVAAPAALPGLTAAGLQAYLRRLGLPCRGQVTRSDASYHCERNVRNVTQTVDFEGPSPARITRLKAAANRGGGTKADMRRYWDFFRAVAGVRYSGAQPSLAGEWTVNSTIDGIGDLCGFQPGADVQRRFGAVAYEVVSCNQRATLELTPGGS
jgi:hypothetical protein